MRTLFFTFAAVASLLCLTPGILRGAPETEKLEIDPNSQVATLLERLEELEVRINNLEKRQPMITTPYHPLRISQPICPVPPAFAPNLENADTPPMRGPSSPPLVKATAQDTIAGMAEVTLSGPNATDVQLNRIRALTTLKELYLIDTQITDDGLEQLKEFAQLEHLVIQGHQASDTGLERLKTLSHLRKLELWGDGITKEGMKSLQQALPKCKLFGLR